MSIRYINSNDLIDDVPDYLQNIINNMDCVYIDGIKPNNQHFNLAEHDKQIRTEVIEEGRKIAESEQIAMCESCIHKVSKEDIDAIRESAIDECIKTIIDYCGGLPNGMYVNALKRLKENSND